MSMYHTINGNKTWENQEQLLKLYKCKLTSRIFPFIEIKFFCLLIGGMTKNSFFVWHVTFDISTKVVYYSGEEDSLTIFYKLC